MEGKCPLGEHSKIESLCEKFCDELIEIKRAEEKQWDLIAKKASTSAIKWGMLIFITVLLATVGFLWNNQREFRNEVVGELKSINTLITGEDGLRNKVREFGWKLDGNLKETPPKSNTEPKK